MVGKVAVVPILLSVAVDVAGVNSTPNRARVTHAHFSRACGSRSHETEVFV